MSDDTRTRIPPLIFCCVILFTNQNIENVVIAMGKAHGSHTGRVAGEAVQYLTLQPFGLQARQTAVTDKNQYFYRLSVL